MLNKNLSRIKIICKTIGFLILLTLIIIAGGKVLKSTFEPYKSVDQNKILNNNELKFNHFTVTIPNDYILSKSPDYAPEIYGKVVTSSLSDESGCVRVGNIQSVILQRNLTINTGYSTWHPVLELQSWNNEEIKYLDVDTKNILQKQVAELSNLSKLSETDISKISLKSFQSSMVVPLFNPWEGYLACAGIYSLPSFIEKQELPPQSNWNEAYYGEVYEGNGDTFGIPVKVVIARNGSDWLLIKEQQRYPNGFKSACPFGDLSAKEFNCANAEWSKLRNPLNYRAWVQQVLSWVH